MDGIIDNTDPGFTHFYRIREEGGSGPPFKHIMHRFKESPLEIPIYFKLLKNILISRFYDQF